MSELRSPDVRSAMREPRVLIVEDRPVDRDYFQTVLSYGGYSVLQAADGAAALEMVRRERPDLVITDLMMPTMDGYALARAIRAEAEIARTRIIFCSATNRSCDASLLTEGLGAMRFVAKPVEPEALLAVVAEVLCAESQSPASDVSAVELDRAHLRLLNDELAEKASALERELIERKRTEAMLVAAKSEAERASQAKSRFLAAASHDLRQPVQSLELLLAVLQRQAVDQPKTLETIRMMKRSMEGLERLLNAILDVSRLDAGVVEPRIESVDLGALVCQLATEFTPLAADKGLELRTAPRPLCSRTDPVLLKRALRNLIENAVRYTPKGGVLIGLRRRGELVRIDVIDTGIGVPADKQMEIFEEFRQLHNRGRDLGQGLGLGLAIVARLADLLGTRVEVASKVGRGSRFSLLLPLDRNDCPAVMSPQAPDDPGGRVLIVEDNSILRHGLESMLQQWGYATAAAACGEDALELAAKEGWRFDVIIADHRLGSGLTGVATAKEIERRAGRAFPTLVLTGDTARERIIEIDASGFAMLHKPVGADDLRRKVAQLMVS
jgi:signal transduction histidine kinase